MTDHNRKFVELCGICWHEYPLSGMCACIKCGYSGSDVNPDFSADPRLVLEVMREREDWTAFKEHLDYILEGDEEMFDLILDRTGKLLDLAIEFMEERK